MPFSPKSLTEDDIKAIREFSGGIIRGSKQFGISKDRFKKIKEANSLEEAIAAAQPKEKHSQGDNGHETDVPLSELKVKGAPVKFRIKDEDITLAADDLLTAYFIFLNMKRRFNLSNSFSEALVIGMQTVWRLTQTPIITEGGEIQSG